MNKDLQFGIGMALLIAGVVLMLLALRHRSAVILAAPGSFALWVGIAMVYDASRRF